MSSEPVYVRYRLVQDCSTPFTDKWGWARPWEPDESWTVQINASFDNAHSGEYHWYLITDVMAVPNPLPFGP